MARTSLAIKSIKKAGFAGGLAGLGFAGTELATSLLASKFNAVATLYSEGGAKAGAAKTMVGALVSAPFVLWAASKSRKAGAVLGGLLGVGVLASAWGPMLASKAEEMTTRLIGATTGKGGPERRRMAQIAQRMEALMDRQGGGVEMLSGGVEMLSGAGGVEMLNQPYTSTRVGFAHSLL